MPNTVTNEFIKLLNFLKEGVGYENTELPIRGIEKGLKRRRGN